MATKLLDPTHGTTEPTRYWTTANIGEATPDVLSPMCWSFWGPAMEAAARLAYADLGILPKSQLAVPADPNELLVSYFYGRPAMNLDRLRNLFNAIPGMTADDFERDICGHVRDGLPTAPASGRGLFVLAKSPAAMVTAGRRVRGLADDQRRWWEQNVLDGGGLDDPHQLLKEALSRFRDAFRAHVRGRFVLMALQAQLTKLAESVGRTDLVMKLLAGLGGVTETDMADDLWLVGHDRLSIDEFVRRHGFHGPNAGNVSSVSWRENSDAPRQLAAAMAARKDEPRPREREATTIAARKDATADLLAALPRRKHATARFLLKAAAGAVQTNEIGKANFLMAIDAGRAATRALGGDDAFYLTAEELMRSRPDDLQELVQFRKDKRNEYRRYELPLTFTGMPEAIDITGRADNDSDVISGVAGAPGEAKGPARVVLDPDAGDEMEPGEILVCRFTDPSWAPLFTLADALVIDIGAAASHGAIVARELGVPCVIGTGDGTRRIRTGDIVRVDGSAGQVEVIERAVSKSEAERSAKRIR